MKMQRFDDSVDPSWFNAMQELHIPTDKDDPLVNQLAHFIDVIKGATPLVSAEDGLQNLKVIEALVLAGQSGTVINID